MIRIFDHDQAVLRGQYPVKVGNLQAVVKNDETFRPWVKQKNLSYFAKGAKCFLESGRLQR